ncbi:MFS transporter [Fastidiosibacter lacustris]|uniref:MFS transporter n=1 Tax=Fastidiosibacter lacustris TaxID=2056695 RepID=UPI000E350BEE|nr:MFS transporter [Fastidiosibacter lacustris]
MSIHKIKGYVILIVLFSAFLLFYKYIMQVFPGLIANDIMSSFSISASEAGSLVAITFWTIVITQLFSGVILDRFGFRLISALSLMTSACGLLLFVYAADISNLPLAYIGRIMIGVGISFATVSYIKATSVWFSPKQFAFVASFLATAAMLGAIVGQAPLSYLISSTGSWHKALAICACIGIVGAILYFLIVRDHNPKQKVLFSEGVSLKWSSIKTVLTNRDNWLLTLYSGLSFTAIDAFAGLWGNNYFKEQYQVSTEYAAGIISMIFLGMAIGSPIIGKLSENFNTKKLMLSFHVVATISLAIVLTFKTSPLISSICLFVFGFCLGIYMLTFAIGRRINSLAVTATVAALINTGEPVLGAIFDPLIGYFLELTWTGDYINSTGQVIHYAQGMVPVNAVKHFAVSSYHMAFSILTLSMVLAFILLCFVKDKDNEFEQTV